jgi:transposase
MIAETFVGVDIHRKTAAVTALDSLGRTLRQATLSSDPKEMTEFLNSLPGTKRVVLEACTMWEPYFDTIRSTGADVQLSHPNKTRLIAEASLKTDRVDSRALANLLRVDSIPPAFAPPDEIRALRVLVRERVFYSRKATSVKNHTYYQLMRKGVRYDDGVLSLKRRREQFRDLKIPEVDRGIDELLSLEQRCKDLDKEVHQAYLRTKEAQLLGSIPGVGELTAVILAAFLCPIERFGNIEKVASYAGLAPTVHQSGENCYHGRLKQDANPLLRWALVEASWVHRRLAKGSDISKTARRVSRRRGMGKGAVAGAHKLLKIAYAVLKRGTPYTPHAPERPAALYSPQNQAVAAAF